MRWDTVANQTHSFYVIFVRCFMCMVRFSSMIALIEFDRMTNVYPVDVVKIIHYSKMCFTKIIMNVRDINSIFVNIIIQLFSFYSEI